MRLALNDFFFSDTRSLKQINSLRVALLVFFRKLFFLLWRRWKDIFAFLEEFFSVKEVPSLFYIGE